MKNRNFKRDVRIGKSHQSLLQQVQSKALTSLLDRVRAPLVAEKRDSRTELEQGAIFSIFQKDPIMAEENEWEVPHKSLSTQVSSGIKHF